MIKNSHKLFRLEEYQGILVILLMLFSVQTFSQSDEKQSERLTREAQKALENQAFNEAEANYRKAISLDEKNQIARYNLGTAYYNRNKNDEALLRFEQAALTATSKEDKHKAFHNLGNVLMNKKMYAEAVEAYKDALRNNPTDDETRYNLALAKELLDKNPPPESDDENDENQEQNQEQNQNESENEDSESQDKEDGTDAEDNKEEENEDSDSRDSQDETGEDEAEEVEQPVPGQLSPQQIQSLLDAMNNEERQVQDKINAERKQGTPIKTDKNW